MALPIIFVNASTSTTPNVEIPVNFLIGFDKYQIGTDPNNSASQEVGIRFHMSLDSPVRSMKLVYPGTTSAATTLRDASYAAIKAAVAQTTV